jgi:undecaprenyl diphosphate synthase
MEPTAPDTAEPLPFDAAPLPRHIAIIMDGNGRWARARGQARAYGHRAGADAVDRTVRACGAWRIPYLTLYAFSTENWTRPAPEVEALMALLKQFLEEKTDAMAEENVRLRAIGDLERLPDPPRSTLEASLDRLAPMDGLTLTLALNYGARDEIVRAARRLARKAREGAIDPDTLDEAVFADHLDTAGTPDPDLVIRTAGEMRLSNFLLWQASYAEFYATESCWPDFGRETLAEAIRAYQGRIRTFGSVPRAEG